MSDERIVPVTRDRPVGRFIDRDLRRAWSGVSRLAPWAGGAALVAFIACDPTPAAAPERAVETGPIVVRVDEVRPAPPSRSVRFSAATRPADRATVAFALPGRIVDRAVDVGDVVAAGDRIASLDAEPTRNQLRAAEAAIDDIEAQRAQLAREQARVARLIEAEIGQAQAAERLESESRRLEAAAEAAGAQRDEARRMLRDSVVTAPVSGIVSQVFAQRGEVVGAGTPVVLILGQGAVEVEVEVPERVFAAVTEGQSVRVDLPMSGRSALSGTVSAVGRATAGPGRLFPIVVTLRPEDGVAAGMAADVWLDVPTPAGVAVPVPALVETAGGGAEVLRVADGVVEPVSVRIASVESNAAIVDGELEPGALVIVAGQGAVVAGDRVEARR
ncbi:MAG: efflux RND transporter periplasmic adaptor subunit [Myxococcales bacterium]|nr:efflux RND transporter periplasmic adaptor subunit [Myxococcales bacterium]MCB9530170.1 efflux RND transporter periplasmic adaptor subunit [Myxococcales bacterium]MCB9534164.1 efflux RND transporter periplasmic adaptor subunit [Myxococcales bacterium]